MYKKLSLKKLLLGLLAATPISAASLNCKKFKSSNPDATVNECIENSKGKISSLDIDALITDELIAQIITMDALSNFKIYHPSYTDDFDLSPLKKLKKLTSLDIHCYRHPKHRSTGSEIKRNSFDNLKSLQKLKIRGCDVIGDQSYIGLTNLRELDLGVSRGSNNVPDLTYLKDNKNFSSLTISNSYSLSDRTILTNLSELKNLKKLEIVGFVIDQQKIDEISSLEKLEELIVSPVDLEDYDIDFSPMCNLKDHITNLSFSGGYEVPIPECFLSYRKLKKLNLTSFVFSEIPQEIFENKDLEELTFISVSNNEIKISENISNLNKLNYLDLSSNYITELPESIGEMKSLKFLNLESNELKSLPESINNLKNLQFLNLSGNPFEKIPNLSGLSNLEQLVMNYINVSEIPDSLFKLTKLKFLEISNTKSSYSDGKIYITEIPESIKGLKNLEELYVNYQDIKKIPANIKKLKNLKILSMTNNLITEIPKELSQLKNLKTLKLSFNDIKELPDFLNTMPLESVDFEGNTNLTGETLTNNNLITCNYSSTQLCIADEKTKCIKSSYNEIEPCVIVPSDCDVIEANLFEKNVELTDVGLRCSDNDDKQLEYLYIDESVIPDDILDMVLSYSTTTQVRIKVDGSKNALEKIGKKLPNVKELTINTEVDTLSLKVLKKLKNLNILKINPYENLCTLKSGSLKYLTGLKNLSLSNIKFSQTVINEFEKLVNLETLNIDYCQYPSNINFDSFKKLQNLKSLTIYSSFEEKTPLKSIPSSFYSLAKLKNLYITYQNITKISSKISKLTKLEDLDLSGNKLISIPSALNDIENLKYVDFQENPTLTGKTLTNINLRSCLYDNTSSICMAEEMECFYDSEIEPCKN